MNNETLLIAPAPTADEVAGVIGSADTVTNIETKPVDGESIIGGADASTDIITTTGAADVSDNLTGSFQILGQGMASIFVVLGLIAVVVAVLKKLDNKKK